MELTPIPFIREAGTWTCLARSHEGAPWLCPSGSGHRMHLVNNISRNHCMGGVLPILLLTLSPVAAASVSRGLSPASVPLRHTLRCAHLPLQLRVYRLQHSPMTAPTEPSTRLAVCTSSVDGRNPKPYSDQPPYNQDRLARTSSSASTSLRRVKRDLHEPRHPLKPGAVWTVTIGESSWT